MRTIQVVNVRWYNATAWYGVTLAKCLQDAGHESIVAGLAGTPPLEKAKEMGLRTIALPFNSAAPAKLFETWNGMDRLVRDFRPDIVNCHRGEAFVLWALMQKKYGFGLVRTRGDRRLPKNGLINRWLHCKAADAVIATNGDFFAGFSGNAFVYRQGVMYRDTVDTSLDVLLIDEDGDFHVLPGHEAPSTLERERCVNYYMKEALSRP
jgi:hypothetical protein